MGDYWYLDQINEVIKSALKLVIKKKFFLENVFITGVNDEYQHHQSTQQKRYSPNVVCRKQRFTTETFPFLCINKLKEMMQGLLIFS